MVETNRKIDNETEDDPLRKRVILNGIFWCWGMAIYMGSVAWMLIEGLSVLYVVLAVVGFAMHVIGYLRIRR